MSAAAKHDDLTVDTIAAALGCINPNVSRDKWWRIAAALKSELGEQGFALFDDWSKGDASGYNARDVADTWKSTKEGGGVNIGTLIREAMAAGFRFDDNRAKLSPEEQERRKREREERERLAAAERRRLHGAAAKLANEIWNSAAQALGQGHTYLEAKGVKAHGVRIGRWPLFKKDSDDEIWRWVENALLVPILDPKNGKYISLQGMFVDDRDGSMAKRYLKNGAKQGGCHIIGTPTDTAPIAFCEGYATGATIHELTGWCVVVCFDAANLPVVAKQMRKELGGAPFLICADNDAWTKAGDIDNPGVHYAKAAAEQAHGHLIVPNFADVTGEPTDWNDLAQREGDAIALAQLLANPVSRPEAANNNAGEGAILPDSTHPAVAEINKSHALAMMGGNVVILRETVGERYGKELQYLSTAAFRTWLMNRTVAVEVTDKEGRTSTKHRPLAEVWLKSPERRQYEGVTFAPAGNAPGSYYNLWDGFTVEPIASGILAAGLRCRRLLAHMKYVLCNGDSGHFRYLLAWAADMVQDPDHKKGVALVMRGAKGTGKSTFADALSALLGRHAMSVSHMRHLTGNFNRHLGDKLLVVAEESYWAGDKADEGPLKHMITSERMTIEAKGVDAVEMPSLCRVMMITNNEWAAPASIDERRYFVLDVSDRRRGDHAYFAALRAEMAGEGLRALLALLLAFPLQSINLRQVPETNALRQQRALSLEPHDQFVYDALCDGALLNQDWDGPFHVGKDALYDAYLDAGRKRGRMHLLPKERFGAKFMRATGAVSAKLRGDGASRLRVYKVPAWEIAAGHFEGCCGVTVLRADNDNDRPF